jgi:hypothetical protein
MVLKWDLNGELALLFNALLRFFQLINNADSGAFLPVIEIVG